MKEGLSDFFNQLQDDEFMAWLDKNSHSISRKNYRLDYQNHHSGPTDSFPYYNLQVQDNKDSDNVVKKTRSRTGNSGSSTRATVLIHRAYADSETDRESMIKHVKLAFSQCSLKTKFNEPAAAKVYIFPDGTIDRYVVEPRVDKVDKERVESIRKTYDAKDMEKRTAEKEAKAKLLSPEGIEAWKKAQKERDKKISEQEQVVLSEKK